MADLRPEVAALDWAIRFQDFVETKTRAAVEAHIPGYVTTETRGAELALDGFGSPWTHDRFDGPFFESAASDPTLPAINIVFVESADGNTGAANPMDLGGGLTDKHLIYEGLSSAHADAILTGSATIRGAQTVMGLWRPELVALRTSLGLPRFPVQVVATQTGDLDVEGALIYNVPEIQVVILTGDAGAAALRPSAAGRPWVRIISTGRTADLVEGLRILRSEFGTVRVSSTGGRHTATQLIDAGVVQDLYLTTSPRAGGEPDTPLYIGAQFPSTTLVVRKAGREAETGVVFRHLLL